MGPVLDVPEARQQLFDHLVNDHLLVKEVAPDNKYDEKQGMIARFVDPLNRKQFSLMDPLRVAAEAQGIPFEEYLVQVGVVDGMIKEFEKVKAEYPNSEAAQSDRLTK